jgi:aspartate kinase
MNEIAVIKFGGSDLASGEKIRAASEMVLNSSYKKLVIIVSAMAETTNFLVESIFQIGDINVQDYADVLSMGERTSARLFCSALRSQGANATYFDPTQQNWPIITDSNFLNAKPILGKTCELIRKHVEPILGKKIAVICGFLGRDREGKITTLGRGGSDTTAMIIANCLKAKEVILVKDTEGVMSADPKIVDGAKSLKSLDIHEMFALASGGAKIIKSESLKYKLPDQKLRVVSFSGGIESEGTEITGIFNSNSNEIIEKKGLLALSFICKISPQNMSKLFASMNNRTIYGISTGKGSLTIFTSSEETKKLLSSLHNLNLSKALSYKEKVGLIELSHPIFVNSPGWIAKISGVLASRDINIIEITTSRATINIFIDESKMKDAVKAVRDVFEV